MTKEIKLISSQNEVLKHIEFFKKIPYVNMSWETMLGRCLIGQYGAISFLEDNEPVGILIFENRHPELYVIGICLQNKVKDFYNLFFKEMKELKYTNIKAISKLPEAGYMKLLGFEKLWTVYGRNI